MSLDYREILGVRPALGEHPYKKHTCYKLCFIQIAKLYLPYALSAYLFGKRKSVLAP